MHDVDLFFEYAKKVESITNDKLVLYSDYDALLKELKNKGITIYGTTLDEDVYGSSWKIILDKYIKRISIDNESVLLFLFDDSKEKKLLYEKLNNTLELLGYNKSNVIALKYKKNFVPLSIIEKLDYYITNRSGESLYMLDYVLDYKIDVVYGLDDDLFLKKNEDGSSYVYF